MSKSKEIQVNFNFHYHFPSSKKIKSKHLKKVEDDYRLVISELEETLNKVQGSVKDLPSIFYNKRGLKINSDKELITKFDSVMNEVLNANLKLIHNQTYNLIKLWIYNIEDYLLKKYGSLLEPTKAELQMLKNKKNIVIQEAECRKVDLQVIYFSIEKVYYQKFFRACFTYYKNEKSNLNTYSSSMFFNDIMSSIDDIEIKFYSLEFLNSLEIIRQNEY